MAHHGNGPQHGPQAGPPHQGGPHQQPPQAGPQGQPGPNTGQQSPQESVTDKLTRWANDPGAVLIGSAAAFVFCCCLFPAPFMLFVSGRLLYKHYQAHEQTGVWPKGAGLVAAAVAINLFALLIMVCNCGYNLIQWSQGPGGY